MRNRQDGMVLVVRMLAVALTASAAAVACNAVSGVDDYQFTAGSGGAAATTSSSSSSGATGSGGAGSSSASGTTGSSSSASGGSCGAGTLDCFSTPGCETNGASDPLHCGSCSKVCRDTEICINSECECRPGLTAVSGVCVDLKTDPSNCGKPNQTCPGMVCQSGTCVAACSVDAGDMITNCGGACVKTDTDPLHCGNCTTQCAVGDYCKKGQCFSYTVPPGCNSCPCNCPQGAFCCSKLGFPYGACVTGECD